MSKNFLQHSEFRDFIKDLDNPKLGKNNKKEQENQMKIMMITLG
jgi:predicted secreted protein